MAKITKLKGKLFSIDSIITSPTYAMRDCFVKRGIV